MNFLKQQLFDHDPFDGFDPSWALPDVDGPLVDYSQCRDAIATIRPKTIAVVGARKGASAIAIGKFCQSEGLTPEIICIDTWLGTARDLYNKIDTQRDKNFALLRQVNGYPMMYFTFMRNIIDAGLTSMITPLPQTAENAAKILRYYDIKIGVAYMDNEPEPAPMFREITLFHTLMESPSVMVGENASKPETKDALTKLAQRTGQKVAIKGNRYSLPIS